MTSQPLTLYGDSALISPYVMSAYVALQEKGLPFELKTVNLRTREHFLAPYSRISLSRRVPTLAHGEFYLSESSAIAEYLEDKFHPPQYPRLYPAELAARAKARELQAWLRSDFMPIRTERPTEVIFLTPKRTPLSAAAQSAAEQLFAAAERLLEPGSEHLFGQWCIADTDLALMLQRLIACGDPVPERLVTYAAAQWQRPSVHSWLRQPRATIE